MKHMSSDQLEYQLGVIEYLTSLKMRICERYFNGDRLKRLQEVHEFTSPAVE